MWYSWWSGSNKNSAKYIHEHLYNIQIDLSSVVCTAYFSVDVS